MKLKRLIVASNGYEKIRIEIAVERKYAIYESDQVRAARKKLVNGIHALLVNELGCELERIQIL